MLLLLPNFLVLLISLCSVSGTTVIDSTTPQRKSPPAEDDLVERQLIPNFNFTTASTDSRNEAKSSSLSESSRAYGSNGVRYLVTSVNQQPPLYIRQPQYLPAPTVTTTTTVSISAPPEPTTSTTTVAPAPAPPPPPPVTLGSNCTTNANCAGISNSSRCVAGICVCAAASVPLSNIGCVPLATVFGDSCVITAQCRGLDPLASCYLDKCMCESIYHVAGQSCPVGGGLGDYFTPSASGGPRLQCLRKQHLGGACCDSRQCAYEVWNSQCMNSTCVCNPGFVNIGTHACAPKATALGQPCSVNAQCMMPGAFCDTNGLCSCNNQTQFVQGVVMPAMPAAGGATDRRKRQIMLSTMCMPTMRLGEMCMSNDQCSFRTPQAICAMGNCTCMSGFLPDINNVVCQRKNISFEKPIFEFQVECCGDNSTSQFVGQVCPDNLITNIGPPFTFTLSDSEGFSIDANGGITTLTQLSDTTTITVTVQVGTRSATALVILYPDPCCLQPPGFSTSAVTINLVRVLPTMTVQPAGVVGCTASNPNVAAPVNLASVVPNTSPFLLNILDFLNEPCGDLVSINLATASVRGIGANGMEMTPALCSLVGGGNVAFFTATAPTTGLFGIPFMMTGTCVVTTTVTACNGLVSTSSLTILLVCV